jgi:hypothetical protein
VLNLNPLLGGSNLHDIAEILLKVALKIIKQTNKPISFMGVVVVVIMW